MTALCHIISHGDTNKRRFVSYMNIKPDYLHADDAGLLLPKWGLPRIVTLPVIPSISELLGHQKLSIAVVLLYAD